MRFLLFLQFGNCIEPLELQKPLEPQVLTKIAGIRTAGTPKTSGIGTAGIAKMFGIRTTGIAGTAKTAEIRTV